MTQFIQSTPGTIAAAMGYQSQVPQSNYRVGQLGLAGGGIARLPYAGGTIAGGNIQGTPMGNRTGFGLFSKAKKRLKKLIPKEIAPAMMAAAPFMGPIAGPIMGGLGSYKTYGKIDPRVMAMSIAPHLSFGKSGVGYGDWGAQGGSSLRRLLTGQGKGTARGILNTGKWNLGDKLDAQIFGSKGNWLEGQGAAGMERDWIPGKSGIFNTKGGPIGIEDVFKTITTDKEGKKSLKQIAMIYTTSATFAEAQNNADKLGIDPNSLNQDEYNRVKASLTGEIPTYATGGRVGFDSGGNLESRIKEIMDRGISRELAEMLAKLEANTHAGVFDIQDGNAQGGIPNTRTGLQWGSDKGEGLGGEEVEADMRYDGGFMPYGEEPKADDVPARLSKDEFVFTDEAVAGAGDGDIDVGAERLYNVMKNLEQGGRLSEESEGIAAQEMEAMI